MAIQIDHNTGAQSPGVSSITMSFTVTNHPNRILLVAIGQDRDNNSVNCDVTSVTYGGTPLTKAIDAQGRDGVTSDNSELWYLLNPPVGTANIVASFPDAGNSENVLFGIDIWNAKQVAPEATGSAGTLNSNSVSTTVTTVKSTALIFAMYANNNQTWDITPDSGITELVESKGNGGCSVAVHYKQAAEAAGYSIGASVSPGTPILFMLAAAAFTPAPQGAGIFALL